MKHPFTALALIAPLAILALGLNAVHAQANDMFQTKAAAEKRAKQLNCSGAFAMGSEWMPCKNFDAYEKAVKKSRNGTYASLKIRDDLAPATRVNGSLAPRARRRDGDLTTAYALCSSPHARHVFHQGRG